LYPPDTDRGFDYLYYVGDIENFKPEGHGKLFNGNNAHSPNTVIYEGMWKAGNPFK